jgi:aspartate/methionine/tyrosine aminotransferase
MQSGERENLMREVVGNLEASRIREVANAGLGREGVLKFWFGESDEVTPAFVTDAAIASLQAGDTFYAHNLGLAELREAIAGYTDGLHPGQGAAHWQPRLAVTSGGVSGLMLACQALIDAGDDVVAVTPVWPNLGAQPRSRGARETWVPVSAGQGGERDGAWVLDMPALLAAIKPGTKLLILNAPNNPTGWSLNREQQATILAHCRQTGTWILADEVYERLYYAGDTLNASAPSFLDVSEPHDRLIVAHSFSKSFLMTGWRLGWLVMPAFLTQAMGKLIEFNTSCAPAFIQRAALTAIQRGEEVTPALVSHLKCCRDTLVPLLKATPGVTLAEPLGGMYAFFRLEGHADCLDTAKRLVNEAGLGLAPGSAFGPEAAGWLRWCFASRDPQRLVQGVERLRGWLASQNVGPGL